MDVKNFIKSHKKAFATFSTAVLAALAALITAVCSSGCGSTVRTTVRNNADSTTTDVRITTSNPTSVHVNPSVSTRMDSISLRINKRP